MTKPLLTILALTIMTAVFIVPSTFAQTQPATTPAQDQTPPLSPALRDDLNICLCQQILARTLCKDTTDFNFIDEYRDSNTYSFTVFYANKDTRFMCMVTEGEVRIKGKAWQTIMRTIPLNRDEENACAIADYSVPECPEVKPIVCCGQKTNQDLQEDKAYDFWSRPIPEILEEELMRDQQRAEPTPPPTENPAN